MDKAVLLKGYLPEDTVTLPSGQGEVRVRGLSRNEAVALQKLGEDATALEVRACSLGMLDPTLTEEEVAAWREVAVAADVSAVAQRISELSNLDDQGGKGPTSRSRSRRN
jgi:hypothetical protein